MSRRNRMSNEARYIAELRHQAVAAIGTKERPAGMGRGQATSFRLDQLTQHFEDLGIRAAAIHRNSRGEALQAWTRDVVESMNTENWMRERHQLMVAATRGDRDAQAELASVMSISVQNMLLAHANWAAFFSSINLANDEMAAIQFDGSSRELVIDTIGEDGGLITVQPELDRTQAFCKLFYLWTQEFEYPLVDIYRGDVASLALATIDIERDFATKINGLLGSYMLVSSAKTRFGNFLLDGSPTAHYVPNTGIHASNLPTTNLITTTPGNSQTSLLRKDVFDEAIQYVEQWGTGAFADGDMQIDALHVASKDSAGWARQVSLTSGSNFAVDQIFQGGALVNYCGRKFAVVYDNTIPATGDCHAYLRTQKKVGAFFQKPGLDQVVTEELKRVNKGSISQGKVVGFGMANPWSVNAAAIRYRNA